MAIYHFTVKVISRANGSSAVAAAAYRGALALHDERLGRTHNFSDKTGVIHSEILLPADAPSRWLDRQTLWNQVEAGEKRKDAQLAREIEFALPREMTESQNVALAQAFVQREFVDRGMVADLNVHWDIDEMGEAKPHAHVMLSLRQAGPEGFGPKAREWNAKLVLEGWRAAWASHVNFHLAKLDLDLRIDHRTLAAQEIELEPQHKIGPAGMRRDDRGEDADRALEHREIARCNGEKIIANPAIAFDDITHQRSTFSRRDLELLVHRQSDGKAQYEMVLSAVMASPDLVNLGPDKDGRQRYSSRQMVGIEQALEEDAAELARRRGGGVAALAADRVLAKWQAGDLQLSFGQLEAFKRVIGEDQLSVVIGHAGSGKSLMLGVARDAWEAQEYRVRGAALSGVAAESLEQGSGIASRTIASLEYAWARGKERLVAGDVLVIDEAGMIGSRQMQRVLAQARNAGAKVVLVGDYEQLQAIEAGAPFRALSERHGAAELTEIRRQYEPWQQEATCELATGGTRQALERYEAAGMVQRHATREGAIDALVEGWAQVRRSRPELSQAMLAHTHADVDRLNGLARELLYREEALGEPQTVVTELGDRQFAVGERLMFLRNERSLGVRNGNLGTLEAIKGGHLVVRLDGKEARRVEVDLKFYNDLDHGYAATIHKSQGVTVERAHLLATNGLDRHMVYVAMTRHRDGAILHYGGDDFADREQMMATLSRERAKDTTLDYVLHPERDLQVEPRPLASELKLVRPAFDEIALTKAPRKTEAERRADKAILDYVRAFADHQSMGEGPLREQVIALEQAEASVHKLGVERVVDLRAALIANADLAAGLVKPGGLETVKDAWKHEGKLGRDAEHIAASFAREWHTHRAVLPAAKTYQASQKHLNEMALELSKLPRVQAALAARQAELGLRGQAAHPGELGKALIRMLDRGREQDYSR